MIYTITCDGELLFDPRLQDYALQNPVLDREANRAGTLSFTIYPGHPMYGQVHFLKSRLKVYRDGTLIFMARPSHVKRNFRGGIEYKCEEILAALEDVLFRPNGAKNYYSNIFVLLMADYVGHCLSSSVMPLVLRGNLSTHVGKDDYGNPKTIAIADDSYPTTMEIIEKEIISREDEEDENYFLPRYGTCNQQSRNGEDCLYLCC